MNLLRHYKCNAIGVAVNYGLVYKFHCKMLPKLFNHYASNMPVIGTSTLNITLIDFYFQILFINI